MAQWVEVLATKSHGLSSISGTHRVRRKEPSLPSCLLISMCVPHHPCAPLLMWDFPMNAENVLLPLVNKEAALAYDRAEYRQVGNPKRDIERK